MTSWKNRGEGALRSSLVSLGRPHVDPVPHALWDFDSAMEQARRHTRKIAVDRDRLATLYLNESAEWGGRDLETLLGHIGDDRPAEHETRSVWFDLEKPISGLDGPLREPIVSVQIKGVVFDSRKPPEVYSGHGWPPQVAFADKEARTCVYDLPRGAVGYCALVEAVKEYNIGLEAAARLRGSTVRHILPLGWGTFDSYDYKGFKLGFEILGLPALTQPREKPYLDALSALIAKNDFGPMEKILRLRASSMRAFHQAGLLLPFRHFGNISLTPAGEVFVHDLGDRRDLKREDLFSDDQFIAETFLNLKYALNPADILVPRPAVESPERLAVLEHLDQYTHATLSGYYGDESGHAGIPFDEIDDIFLKSFDTPFTRIAHPFVEAHCRIVGEWLRRRRAA